MNEKITPYTTKTGIQIGRFYERRQSQPMSFDMEMIQSAYLNVPLRGERLKNLAYVMGVALVLVSLILITKN